MTRLKRGKRILWVRITVKSFASEWLVNVFFSLINCMNTCFALIGCKVSFLWIMARKFFTLWLAVWMLALYKGCFVSDWFFWRFFLLWLGDEGFLCYDWLMMVVFALIGCMVVFLALIGCWLFLLWLADEGCLGCINIFLLWLVTKIFLCEFSDSDIFCTNNSACFSLDFRVTYFLFICFCFRENLWDTHSRTGALGQGAGRDGIQSPDIIP